ncbi:MAG: hypothetical protein GY927_02630 [bacterium]|nr:hypothetical protein [bacterium]
MSETALASLAGIDQLKVEPPTRIEFEGLLRSGQRRLLPNEQWRVLDQAHRKRNLAEYEGDLDVDETLLAALIRVAREVEKRVAMLTPLN